MHSSTQALHAAAGVEGHRLIQADREPPGQDGAGPGDEEVVLPMSPYRIFEKTTLELGYCDSTPGWKSSPGWSPHSFPSALRGPL